MCIRDSHRFWPPHKGFPAQTAAMRRLAGIQTARSARYRSQSAWASPYSRHRTNCEPADGETLKNGSGSVSYTHLDVYKRQVYTYCVPKDKSYPYVLSDDENASLEIGRALISMGHRRIGIISGPVNSFNSQKRLVGIQQALFEASIPYNVGTTVIGDWTRECGYHAASQLLSQGVTAIYAFSDKMISGVYTYCIEHRICLLYTSFFKIFLNEGINAQQRQC